MAPQGPASSGGHVAKSILGVGLLALPRVFSLLGTGAGAISLVVVALLAYASQHALTKASTRTGVLNLSVLTRHQLGTWGHRLLNIAFIANCFGMLVVYLIVIGDMLVGSPKHPGILTPDCGSRRVVLTVITLVLLLPLVSAPTKRSRSAYNAVADTLAIVAIVVWIGVALVLFIIAYSNDELKAMHWWPRGHALVGHGFKSAVQFASLLAIMLVAYTCHWTLAHSMQDESSVRQRQAQGLSAVAVILCTAAFLVVAICSYGVFGKETSPDVLNNYNLKALKQLVWWSGVPEGAFFGIRLGVLLALILSFPFHMAPMRSALWQLLFHQPLLGPGTHLVSFGILAAALLVAAPLTTIWGPLILIGSTAGAFMSLIVPGLISMSMEEALTEGSGSRLQRRAGGLVLVVAGLTIGLAGVLHLILYGKHSFWV